VNSAQDLRVLLLSVAFLLAEAKYLDRSSIDRNAYSVQLGSELRRYRACSNRKVNSELRAPRIWF